MEPAILRLPQVLVLTGLSKTTLWRQVRAGEFPLALRLDEQDFDSGPADGRASACHPQAEGGSSGRRSL